MKTIIVKNRNQIEKIWFFDLRRYHESNINCVKKIGIWIKQMALRGDVINYALLINVSADFQ